MMLLEQYCIFHNISCKLAEEVIKVFLHRSDRALWHAVFVKEKNVCQDNKEIREFIRSNPALELEYRETLCGAQQYV